MSLADEYRRQLRWRDWAAPLAALPPLRDRLVLDLGCAVGDVAAELAARGARVLGFDRDEELLAVARSHRIRNARFEPGDLRALPHADRPADGIWCSFVTAYFPQLVPVLREWAGRLAGGGWIALTEIDDLFGHEPLPEHARATLGRFAAHALATGRYDFHMGGKLRRHLEEAGFSVTRELTLTDGELSFDGPAVPEVVEAWRSRLARMTALQEFCGAGFERLRDDFLRCLVRDDHASRAAVRFCLARRRERGPAGPPGDPLDGVVERSLTARRG
jgi:SAM-dependent methyltransferase